MSNKRKRIEKYTGEYMSIGMVFGLLYGQLRFSDNLYAGLCLGMAIGVAIGLEKDIRLSKRMMGVIRIEFAEASSTFLIFVEDKYGENKLYRVSKMKMKEEKFRVGNRVAEERKGVLVSLESR